MEGKKQNQCLLNHQLSSETIEKRAEKVLKCSFPKENSIGEGTASKLRLGRNCVEHLSDLLILKKKKKGSLLSGEEFRAYQVYMIHTTLQFPQL